MRALFCSVAAAIAVLAAMAIPSEASTFNFGSGGIGPQTFVNDPLLASSFTITSPDDWTIIGTDSGFDTPFTLAFTSGGTPVVNNGNGGFHESGVLGPGTYNLYLNGSVPPGTEAPSFFGFGGTLTLDAIATPIPASLMLFVSGLGFLGFVGWNKKRKSGTRLGLLEAASG